MTSQANFTSTGTLTGNATNVTLTTLPIHPAAPGTTAVAGISGEVTEAAGAAGVDAGLRDDRYYLGMYGGTLLLGLVIMLIGASMAAQVRVRTARALHDGMLKKVLRAPISFYDVTPLGRVLNRFSKDQNNVDIQLSMMLMWAVCVTNFCLSSFLAIVISTSGIGLVVVIPALGLYYLILRYVRLRLFRCPYLSRIPTGIFLILCILWARACCSVVVFKYSSSNHLKCACCVSLH